MKKITRTSVICNPYNSCPHISISKSHQVCLKQSQQQQNCRSKGICACRPTALDGLRLRLRERLDDCLGVVAPLPAGDVRPAGSDVQAVAVATATTWFMPRGNLGAGDGSAWGLDAMF